MMNYNEIVTTDLTKDQIKKLKKGQNIRLKPSQLQKGSGYLHLNMEQYKKWKSSAKKGKGMNLKFPQEQVGMNPLLMTIAEVAMPLVAEKAIDTIIDSFKKNDSKKKKSK